MTVTTGESGKLVDARATRYDLYIGNDVVGTLQLHEHDGPVNPDVGVPPATWLLEVSTWDRRRITLEFATELAAHSHAERLMQQQTELLRVVDAAKREGKNFQIVDDLALLPAKPENGLLRHQPDCF